MTTTVTLGGGGRRWWPFLAGAGLLWVLVALLVGGGEDDEPAALASSTTTAPGSTTTAGPSSTTLPVAVLAGIPPSLAATGDLLVVGGSGAMAVVALATGDIDTYDVELVDGNAAGVLVRARGSMAWWPGADSSAAVDLGPGGSGLVAVDAGIAWTWTQPGIAGMHAAAWRLDGGPLVEVDVPDSVMVVGVVAGELVLSAGGDTLVVARDGAVRRIDGQPLLATGRSVVLRRCDVALQCSLTIDDLAGHVLPFGANPRRLVAVTGAGPDGRAVVEYDLPGEAVVRSRFLLGAGGIEELGRLRGLPDPMAWTPDGLVLGALGVQLDVYEVGGDQPIAGFTLPFVAERLAVVRAGT